MAKKPTIVEAAMVSGSAGKIGAGLTGAQIADAMHAAVEALMKRGITDPAKHREAMLAAREKVKAAHAKLEAKAAKAAARKR